MRAVPCQGGETRIGIDRDSANTTPADELRATARLLFDTVSVVVGLVARTQRAIAGSGPRPPAATDTGRPEPVDGFVYGRVQTGVSLGATVADLVLSVSGLGHRHHPLQDSVPGRRVGAVLNGAVGDTLASRYPALGTPLRLRHTGADVPTTARSLADHYPDASGHLVVMIHGLVENEEWWQCADADRVERVDFGQRLAEDLGATALYVRYNTGRHICDNGRDMADLLARVVDAWPVAVRRISLVGHSMGGLVARSAVHHAVADDRAWVSHLGEVVCLGSPHQGSDAERVANVIGRTLGRFARSAPLAMLFTLRSAGIKDLRYGYLVESDWSGRNPEAVGRPERGRAYATAPLGRQLFLAATVARDPDSWCGRIFGDLLVTPASATDVTQQADRRALGGVRHFELLHHPRVYAELRDWLAAADLSAPRPQQPGRQANDQRGPG